MKLSGGILITERQENVVDDLPGLCQPAPATAHPEAHMKLTGAEGSLTAHPFIDCDCT